MDGGRGWSQQSSHLQRQPCKHVKIATITMGPTGGKKIQAPDPNTTLAF